MLITGAPQDWESAFQEFLAAPGNFSSLPLDLQPGERMQEIFGEADRKMEAAAPARSAQGGHLSWSAGKRAAKAGTVSGELVLHRWEAPLSRTEGEHRFRIRRDPERPVAPGSGS